MLTLKHTHVNLRSTLDVCMCMYACTLGADLTLLPLCQISFILGGWIFSVYVGLIGILFSIGGLPM